MARTLLVLGGSRQQTVAIERARSLGYRTVVCDYLPGNPGRLVADAWHSVSTTDREAVLEVARKERASGVLAYASDPAAPADAYVAEALSLPTNPLAAVEALSVKTRFRAALRGAGLPCPGSAAVPAGACAEEALALVSGLRFPLVVKPTDSSGSKGVAIAWSEDGLAEALALASARSRNGVLIAEEYIERMLPQVVGGDVFVRGGNVEFWGLMSCLRDSVEGLVPCGKLAPVGLSAAQDRAIKAAISRLVSHLGIRYGELNVEVIVGEDGAPYLIELGARAGGNMIPVQLSDASGIDLVAANVRCAMGEDPGDLTWDSADAEGAFATYVLHSPRAGEFCGLRLSPEAEAACYRMVLYARIGDAVEAFADAGAALGILFFRFGSAGEAQAFLAEVAEHVSVQVG